ncbi:MAG: hypothetical protein AAF724_02015 [Pseudomonadota bacterium]
MTVALLAFAALAPPSLAQSPDLLAMLDGRWKGEGWARQNTDGDAEKVRCRIENTYFSKSERLVVKGQCAVPGRKFDLTGTVSRRNGGDVISGQWSNPFGTGNASVRGAQSGNRIDLDFSAPHPDTNRRAAHRMQWDIGDGTFSLTTRLVDDDITLSELRFSR